jgi:hypothetical protein
MPIPQRLISEEKAIALLSSVLLRLPPSSPFYCMARIEQARAKRQIAVSKKQMTHIWKEENSNDHINPKSKLEKEISKDSDDELSEENIINIKIDYRSESLKYINELRESENLLKSWPTLSLEYQYGAILNFEIMENFGLLAREISLESLSRFQNYEVLGWMFGDLIKKFTPPINSQLANYSSPSLQGGSSTVKGESKMHLLQRLSKIAVENGGGVGGELAGLINEFKCLEMGRDIPGWKDVKEIMPNNSAYLVKFYLICFFVFLVI